LWSGRRARALPSRALSWFVFQEREGTTAICRANDVVMRASGNRGRTLTSDSFTREDGKWGRGVRQTQFGIINSNIPEL
jgi:hypothetical protein